MGTLVVVEYTFIGTIVAIRGYNDPNLSVHFVPRLSVVPVCDPSRPTLSFAHSRV